MRLVRAKIGGAAFLCARCDQHYDLPYVLRLIFREKLPETG